MKDIVNLETIDARIGYRLVKNEAGKLVDCGLYRHTGGRWTFTLGAAQETVVANPWKLQARISGWKAQGDVVTLFRCCNAPCNGAEQQAFDQELAQAGGKVSHGYCNACVAAFRAELETIAA